MVGEMKFERCFAVAAWAAILAVPAAAGDLTEVFHKCVTTYATSTQGATVTLECVAADGKVSNCKVTDGPTPRAGFDRAALCVAAALPIGNKTGTITFPIKFEQGHY